MTDTTKSALAAELGVTKARVSQYVGNGLPVRRDGKLDREAALNWIGLNCVSGADNSKGPARARALARVAPKSRPTASDTMVAALTFLLERDQTAIAEEAVRRGVPMATVYAIASDAHYRLLTLAKDYVAERAPGREGFTLGAIVEPDWEVLAELAGEPCDEDEWVELMDDEQPKSDGEQVAW